MQGGGQTSRAPYNLAGRPKMTQDAIHQYLRRYSFEHGVVFASIHLNTLLSGLDFCGIHIYPPGEFRPPALSCGCKPCRELFLIRWGRLCRRWLRPASRPDRRR